MRRLVAFAAAVALLASPALAHGAPLVTLTGGYVVPDGDYSLRVQADGSAVAQLGHRSRRFHLGAHDRRMLRKLLRRSGFGRLARLYRSVGPPVVGARADVVAYRGRKVTVEPGAHPPGTLRALLADLHALLDLHRP